MPRLNIEEEFWSDVRVKALAKKIGEAAAVGHCVLMMKLAQRYWNGSCKPIPAVIWSLSGFPNEVFEVGLARKVEGGVYVAGSEKHFEWYKQKCEAGKIGGRASAGKRMADEATVAQAVLNECSSDRQPSSSSSSSSSSSEEQRHVEDKLQRDRFPDTENKGRVRPAKARAPKNSPLSPTVLAAHEAAYAAYPRHEGKAKGMDVCARTILTEAAADRLLQAVNRYASRNRDTDRKYIKLFSSFMHCWEDYLEPTAEETAVRLAELEVFGVQA